jgi:hypothetical protein
MRTQARHACASLPVDGAGSTCRWNGVWSLFAGMSVPLARGNRKGVAMSYTDVGSAAGDSYFLDVGPMISALQFQPADFEFSHGWLRHVPSRHRFKFDKKGRVVIDARCDCSYQSVSLEHSDQLYRAFTAWQQFYWRPREIDREFASHFEAPSSWVRLLRDIRMAWRRFRRQEEPAALPTEALVMITVPTK